MQKKTKKTSRASIFNKHNFAVYVEQKDGSKMFIGDAKGFSIEKGNARTMPRLVIKPARHNGNFEVK